MLLQQRGTHLRLYVPAGTEEIVAGCRHRVMVDAFVALYWTDRWYNVWQIDRTAGLLYYANVAMPCRFDGRTLHWIDLDIDILRYADGSVQVKDEAEFEERSGRLAYPQEVIEQARAARDELFRCATRGVFPFCRQPPPQPSTARLQRRER